MYEILKSALNDALTENYAAALMDSTEEGCTFSAAFEKKMKALIRKKDRPYYKYIGYLSAAACAVIVIGCSILLPKLTSGSVPTATTPPETEESIVTDIVTETPPTSTETSFTTTPASAAEIVTETSSSEEEAAPVITSESTTTITTPKSETTVPIIVTTIESSTETKTETPDRGDDDIVDEAYEDDDEDEAAEEEITDESTCEDDDEDVEEDCDEDTVEVEDDDVHLPSVPHENDFGTEIKTLIGVPLAESYPYFAELHANGNVCSYTRALTKPEIMEKLRDKDIAQKLEKAEILENTPVLSNKYISLSVSDTDPNLWDSSFQLSPSNSDYSPRNRYAYDFLGEIESDEFDVDDEVLAEEDYEFNNCSIDIYDNGVIAVTMVNYMDTAYFSADSDTISEIFARAEQNEIGENISTVGDLLQSIAASEKDLKNVLLSTQSTTYDIMMSAYCPDGEYLYTLLNEYSAEPVTYSEAKSGASLLSFCFISLKNKHQITLRLYADSTAQLKTGCACYSFSFPLDKTLDALDYLCELNGKEPAYRYATLGEYLAGKNFKGFSYLSTVTDAVDENNGETTTYTVRKVNGAETEAAKEITEIIKKAADKAEYVISPSLGGGERIIDASVTGWNNRVCIHGDYLFIGDNAFKLPDGTNEQIVKIISQNGETETYTDYNDVSEDIDD